jgi:hypothetical protein
VTLAIGFRVLIDVEDPDLRILEMFRQPLGGD